MSFSLSFYPKTAIASFKGKVPTLSVTNAFVEITEHISVKKLTYTVFDFTGISSYTMPEDYKERVKFVTQFSISYNTNIHIIIIATNDEVKKMATGFTKHKDNLTWKYFLFENMEEVKKQFPDMLD